jgi:hypothetical protein
MTDLDHREIQTAGGRGRRICQVREFMRALRQPAVKARDGAATLPGRLHAVTVEPLEMPAASEAPRARAGGRAEAQPERTGAAARGPGARAVNGAGVREAGHPAPIEPTLPASPSPAGEGTDEPERAPRAAFRPKRSSPSKASVAHTADGVKPLGRSVPGGADP